MLRQVLEPAGYVLEMLSGRTLAAEVITRVHDEQPALIVVAALPPGGVSQTRYLCKRLRMSFPNLKILVGRWGHTERLTQMRERLMAIGVNHVATTLLETRSQLTPLLHFFSNAQFGAEPITDEREPVRSAG
jgi:hypothetical protein